MFLFIPWKTVSKVVKTSFYSAFLIIILGGLLIYPGESYSARGELAIGMKVFEKMQAAQVEIEAKNFDKALRLLDEIFETSRLNNFERAQTLSLKGNIYFQIEDFDQSIEMFKQAVEFEDLPKGYLKITLKTLAQLSFMQDQYEASLKYAFRLLSLLEEPDPELHMVIAQVYYKMEKFDLALSNAKQAIAIDRQKGFVIKENWLLILNAIYYSLEDYPQMAEVLKELIKLYPKDNYIKNLAAIYGQMDETKKQLLLMEPLYDKGYLKNESELVNLAQLMVLHKVPYKGAVLMEKALKEKKVEASRRNMELLAQSWQLAAEDQKSIEYLGKAASIADSAELYVRLAQAYMNLFSWKDAEDALEKALGYDDLERVGDTQILLGMTRFYQKDYRSAKKAFRRASEHDNTHHLAGQWITYMEQEIAKEELANVAN